MLARALANLDRPAAHLDRSWLIPLRARGSRPPRQARLERFGRSGPTGSRARRSAAMPGLLIARYRGPCLLEPVTLRRIDSPLGSAWATNFERDELSATREMRRGSPSRRISKTIGLPSASTNAFAARRPLQTAGEPPEQIEALRARSRTRFRRAADREALRQPCRRRK